MAPLSQIEIANWIALYVAAGLCCGFAVILSGATIVVQLYQERVWTGVKTARDAFLFVPRAWWRWKKLYLLSMPVTLCIVGGFAATLSWG